MAIWWPVARSEEVRSDRPLNVDIADQPVVLWRDAAGTARALEDRCPHRRAPLSLGCIRDNGWIQCGYHGWSYDGESGRLKEIPNMKGEQRFPPSYRAMKFAVAESGGFIRVCLDGEAVWDDVDEPVLEESGTVQVALDHEQYVAALFDDPSLLIAINGVQFTTYPLSEVHEEQGLLVMERSCQWRGLHWPAFATADFPLSLLTRTQPDTGETQIELRDDARTLLLRATMGIVPGGRGVTQVRWRMQRVASAKGLRRCQMVGRKLFSVKQAIDGAALRILKPSVSIQGRILRERMTARPAAAA